MSDTPPDGYRPCAGAVVFNQEGLVFLGRRADLDADASHAWQLPQGGLDAGEDPEAAARRELFEETGMRSVDLLGVTPGWIVYDFPPELQGKRFRKYRGQAQKWYAYSFNGTDAEIDLTASGHVEFSDWTWMPLKDVTTLIVPFKRPVYESIVQAFKSFARQ